MPEIKASGQKYVAIKKVKLGKGITGVIYKGSEDNLYYTRVKTKPPKDDQTIQQPPKDWPFEDNEMEGESEDEKNEESKKEDGKEDKQSIWDKIRDKFKDKKKEDEKSNEVFERSQEITTPDEWLPRGVTQSGQMDNDISENDIKELKEQEKKEEEERIRKRPGIGCNNKPGEFVDYPHPNEVEYNALYQKCAPIIAKMKDSLKFSAVPVATRKRFIKQGVLMQDALARGIPHAMSGRQVENIYRRTIRKIELQESYIVLLVDLSGSIDIDTMKKAFTVIAETAGQWLPDSKFALYIFGTNFAKLKGFDEEYLKVRYRIGGIDDWRMRDGCGTAMELPLKHIYKFTKKNLPNVGQKVLINVSDFLLYYSFSSYSRKYFASSVSDILQIMEKEGWLIVNLGTPQCDANTAEKRQDEAREAFYRAKDYPGLAFECPEIERLPDIFFQIYKAVSFAGGTKDSFRKVYDQ